MTSSTSPQLGPGSGKNFVLAPKTNTSSTRDLLKVELQRRITFNVDVISSYFHITDADLSIIMRMISNDPELNSARDEFERVTRARREEKHMYGPLVSVITSTH